MMFAQVIHPSNPDRRFWFEVPCVLTHWVQVDDDVICNTAKGLARGSVVRTVDGLSDNEFEDLFGFFPTAEVVGVYKDVYFDNIDIPLRFDASLPAPSKIAKRVEELYNGRFKTRIELRNDLVLKDGYTAYLVAKMFDLTKLPDCLISIGDKSVFKEYAKKGAAPDDR